MATTTHLMTVEEFQNLPQDDGPVYHELHHGELIAVPRPNQRHVLIQRRMFRLLDAIASASGDVYVEYPFRALPEHEMRVADVAFVARERVAGIDPDKNLSGAPDLVIEILSPSNTAGEMLDKQDLCFANGCREFWVIDPPRRIVRVAAPQGPTTIVTIYRSGQELPLPMFGGAKIAVDAIFGDC